MARSFITTIEHIILFILVCNILTNRNWDPQGMVERKKMAGLYFDVWTHFNFNGLIFQQNKNKKENHDTETLLFGPH